MVKFNINLNTISSVQKFASNASKCDFDVDLVAGRYVIDGKSIMGIFSLNLSKSIEVRCHCDKDDVHTLIEGLDDCVVSEFIQV